MIASSNLMLGRYTCTTYNNSIVLRLMWIIVIVSYDEHAAILSLLNHLSIGHFYSIKFVIPTIPIPRFYTSNAMSNRFVR